MGCVVAVKLAVGGYVYAFHKDIFEEGVKTLREACGGGCGGRSDAKGDGHDDTNDDGLDSNVPETPRKRGRKGRGGGYFFSRWKSEKEKGA